jgi:hypothetical protein
MELRIEPYSSRYASGIARLNARLEAANIDPGFRLPVGETDEQVEFSSEPAEPLRRRQYLLIADGNVRGGFLIQEQRFEVAGQLRWVANIQMPLSEGIIDRRFGLVAAQMMQMILATKPLVFAVGMGGDFDQPFARLAAKMRWALGLVPFAFRALNPDRFVRHIRLAGRSRVHSTLISVATATGIARLVLTALQNANSVRCRLGAPPTRPVTPERVTEWGQWTDTVWNRYRHQCSFAAVRDHQTLPAFHPLSHEGFQAHRFQNDDGNIVGWSAIQLTAMNKNRYFGDMRVATLLDTLAIPGWEDSMLNAVIRVASRAEADLIICNQHHRGWRRAQQRMGMLGGPSNYLLALSPQLAAALGPLAPGYERLHITRADGDGRVHLS